MTAAAPPQERTSGVLGCSRQTFEQMQRRSSGPSSRMARPMRVGPAR